MFYGEVLPGAPGDVHKYWIELPLWWFNDNIGHLLKSALWYVSQGTSQLEQSGHVDFCLHLYLKSPLHLVRGFATTNLVFLIPQRWKRSASMEIWKITHTPVKLANSYKVSIPTSTQRINSNLLFCVRNLCAENMCAGPYKFRKNIHHYLLCQTETEGQTGSMPGSGGHTYLWKMEQISLVALTLTVWFKVVVIGRVVLWAAYVG